MSTYANGKYAYGICDITGFRYRLRDMKMTWDGFLVGPDQWSPKHPQLSPRPATVDREALKNPRPDNADDNNFFPISSELAFNYLRFNIFPDGGVARLRVYGKPVGEWNSSDPNGYQELSAVVNGGNIVGYNDAHYGDPWVMLAPGRGINMGDGWETRRRREPGNDWIVISLGAPGIVERIELDTAHFKGNYPDSCSVQGELITNTSNQDMLNDRCNWPELMGKQKLGMDQIHNFDGEQINKIGKISHVRLNIFPDGGVSRFRIFGSISKNDI